MRAHTTHQPKPLVYSNFQTKSGYHFCATRHLAALKLARMTVVAALVAMEAVQQHVRATSYHLCIQYCFDLVTNTR